MSKRRFLMALLAVAAMGVGSAALPVAQGPVTAFVSVNVIPMDTSSVLTDQTVVVADGRISAMGPARTTQMPQSATRVEGKGKFLIPALAEMHAHIPGGAQPDTVVERTLFLYAANGVATIRGMLGDPRHLVYRERAAKGEIVSPRIYTSGPSFNAKTAPSVEVAVESVIAQKKAGYDLLKIHPGVPRPVFDALAAKAHELNIPFAGHVPLDVGLQRALEAKYRSIDHLDGYVEAMAKNPMSSQFFGINLMDEVDESKIPSLVAATKAAGTWQVPTQVLFDNLMNDETADALAARPEMKHVLPADQIKNYIAQKAKFLEMPQANRQKFLTLRRRLIKALHDAGVPFALGSDAPQVWNVPGFSAHRELESLVAAGLTPYQALKTGTVNIGVYFGAEKTTGTVATGKRADLLLLDANPLENITNTTKIAGVMLNGRWLPKAEIDKRLAAGN
jgi:imidazolonepropionase-like amidohydrolase